MENTAFYIVCCERKIVHTRSAIYINIVVLNKFYCTTKQVTVLCCLMHLPVSLSLYELQGW